MPLSPPVLTPLYSTRAFWDKWLVSQCQQNVRAKHEISWLYHLFLDLSGQGYFICCPTRKEFLAGATFPAHTLLSEAVFLVRSCAKWKNCILNGLWVERQTGRFEGLACRVSSGICVSTGSGSSFCMPGEENNNDSGHNHFYTVMACINVGRGLDSQEWQQNSHTRPKIYSRQGSSK